MEASHDLLWKVQVLRPPRRWPPGSSQQTPSHDLLWKVQVLRHEVRLDEAKHSDLTTRHDLLWKVQVLRLIALSVKDAINQVRSRPSLEGTGAATIIEC